MKKSKKKEAQAPRTGFIPPMKEESPEEGYIAQGDHTYTHAGCKHFVKKGQKVQVKSNELFIDERPQTLSS
jgi:hypothetical protein